MFRHVLAVILLVPALVTGRDAPAPPATGPAGESADMPRIIPDPSAGDWVVDRFAGNSTAGGTLLQGPAREAGGLGRCGACPLPDGTVYLVTHDALAEVDREGMLRLVLEDRDLLQGTTGQVCAAVVAYNPADKSVYLPGRNCIRRLVAPPGRRPRAEVVAGTPGKAGFDDGPAASATFTRIDSIVIDSKGTMYILDANRRLRRLRDGQVSTLSDKLKHGKAVDGPLEKATFNLIDLGGNICLGEADHVLYLSDHWNYCVRRIDLRAGGVSTVAGMDRPAQWRPAQQTPREKRYNANCDGPALTWASFNSGCAYVCYDPVHGTLWCGGPDENRFRWLKGDQVLTVIGSGKNDRNWPRDAAGVPADQVVLPWNAVVAADAQGRVYISSSSDPNGLWRARNTKEGKP